jgi:hypothetical protein
MKLQVTLTCVGSLLICAAAQAQTPQTRPDARYPSPSGQDSRPSTTMVKPAPAPPVSKAPQDGKRGAAAPNTYVEGRKRDASGGCSTPTDAQSAQSSSNPQDSAKKPRDDKNTVCTTSGESGQSANEPKVASKGDKEKDAARQEAARKSATPSPR